MLIAIGNVIFVAIIVVIARCGYKLEKADEEKERAQALSFFAQSFILMEWLAPHLFCLSFNGLRQESLQLRTSVECAFAQVDKMLHTHRKFSLYRTWTTTQKYVVVFFGSLLLGSCIVSTVQQTKLFQIGPPAGAFTAFYCFGYRL